jgi:signal recognition particle subunit SRP54
VPSPTRCATKAVGAEVLKSIKPGQMVVKIVHDELVKMLGETQVPIDLCDHPADDHA